jgi:hypothetical protein
VLAGARAPPAALTGEVAVAAMNPVSRTVMMILCMLKSPGPSERKSPYAERAFGRYVNLMTHCRALRRCEHCHPISSPYSRGPRINLSRAGVRVDMAFQPIAPCFIDSCPFCRDASEVSHEYLVISSNLECEFVADLA